MIWSVLGSENAFVASVWRMGGDRVPVAEGGDLNSSHGCGDEGTVQI